MAASSQEGGGEAGMASGMVPVPMSAAMQKMVGKNCPEYSNARGGDGRELECMKGLWQLRQAKTSTVKLKSSPICVYRCTHENGVHVCRGNGPQCNGVSPW